MKDNERTDDDRCYYRYNPSIDQFEKSKQSIIGSDLPHIIGWRMAQLWAGVHRHQVTHLGKVLLFDLGLLRVYLAVSEGPRHSRDALREQLPEVVQRMQPLERVRVQLPGILIG
eukprot:scaffold176261_cov21-Prasinocladus_malaysianus.AAC.1